MEFRENRAIYLQIADLLCSDIIAGRTTPGDRVPSVRELAMELTVNPATVLRGYEYLTSLGVIEVRRGIGYSVCPGARERVIEVRREEFLEQELPLIKAKMEELGIGWDEIMGKKQ